MKDIWVRFNAPENLDPVAGLQAFTDKHESVWYPIADEVPELRQMVESVLQQLPTDVELGGVLVTRIPAGEGIDPHVDKGWHAEYYYDKYIVQLLGNEDQSFNFEGHSLSAEPGEVYWFNNQELHWVLNDSNEWRMSLIICVRPKE